MESKDGKRQFHLVGAPQDGKAHLEALFWVSCSYPRTQPCLSLCSLEYGAFWHLEGADRCPYSWGKRPPLTCREFYTAVILQDTLEQDKRLDCSLGGAVLGEPSYPRTQTLEPVQPGIRFPLALGGG
jgi:hypothetical protein